MRLQTLSGIPDERIAILGGGCFWCLEAVYKEVKGVESVEPGYAGGFVPSPTYRAVSTGGTGHAEVVLMVFEPEVVSYQTLLDIFFAIHDPTTLDRQGHDVGSQYRSTIMTTTPEQRAIALALIDELTRKRVYRKPIVTRVEAAEPFWAAESYHRDYYDSNFDQPYCERIIAPKLAKFREQFADHLKLRG